MRSQLRDHGRDIRRQRNAPRRYQRIDGERRCVVRIIRIAACYAHCTVDARVPSDEGNRTIDGTGGCVHRCFRNAQQRTEYEGCQRLAGTKQSVRGTVEASVGCLLCPEILRSPRKRAALTLPRARGGGRRRQEEDAAVNAHDRP